MKIIRRLMALHLSRQLDLDFMIYGSRTLEVKRRHKWNPMRLILGEFIYKRVDPRTILERYK